MIYKTNPKLGLVLGSVALGMLISAMAIHLGLNEHHLLFASIILTFIS